MNRNTVIGLVLIFAIFIGYSLWMTPSKKELEAQKRHADSIAYVNRVKQDSVIRVQAVSKVMDNSHKESQTTQEKPVDSTLASLSKLKEQLGAFAGSATGVNKHYTIENDLMKIRVSAEGGKIDYVELKNYKSWDKHPLVLFNDSVNFGYTFFSNNRLINTNHLYFKPFVKNKPVEGTTQLKVSGKDSVQFTMRLYPDADDSLHSPDKYIEYTYTLRGNDYMLGYRVNFVSMTGIIDPNTKYLVLNWDENLNRQEKSLDMERRNTTVYYKYFEDKVDNLKESKDDEKMLKNERIKWISFNQQFFSSTIIADNFFSEPRVKVTTLAGNGNHLKSMSAEIGIPFTPEIQSVGMALYFGPNKFRTLKSYHLDLERQIPLGWGFFLMAWINIYAVIPVFNFFGNFGWNYGIIILILTILLKTVLFPIAFKTYKSSAKMRALKPDIEEITKRYPKKEDAMKKQSATMELYKKAGVNPMAGCIPLLLQMPILFAMFRFFPSSIELRQQAFLWAKDLSSYDAIWTFPNGFRIPAYGDHVSLFALLMTISSIFYTRINDQMMGSTQTQMPGMKTMMYLMPAMFLFWFNDYSSGLSYYYLLANLLTFAQIYIIRATIDEDKLHAQIQENKKKAVKKSGFQKRLENMAKQRGYAGKK
ncbi:MAG: membrane protein insertase YidC [Bacteroidetes bacterium]|nr:membrane protein insertase YidC [Bacteroidota bacterium]